MGKEQENKYKKLAQALPEFVGGADNVALLSHCMTRLRVDIADKNKVKTEEIQKLPGVKGAVWSGNQLQIIIGQTVDQAYAEVSKYLGTAEPSAAASPSGGKRKISLMALMEVMSGCIAPILPVLIGAGMLKVVMLVCQSIGLITPESPTYITLNFASDAAFYFLPIYTGAAAARKFNMNMFVGMFFGAMQVHPIFTAMCESGAAGSIFGIPIYAGTYTSAIFPVILTVWVASYVEHFMQTHSPTFLRTMLVPFGTMLVMTPVSLCVLAPIGSIAGTYFANAIIWLYETCGFIAVALLAAVHPIMVAVGMQHGMGPYLFNSFATIGYEPLASPATFIDNINIGASCLAVGMKSKVTDVKTEAIASGISASVSGITEPGLFGIVMKNRKVLYSVMLGNLAGGVIAGITGTVCYAFAGSYGFFGLATFMGEAGFSNLLFMILAVAVGFIITFIVTFVLYKDETEDHKENTVEKIAVKESQKKELAVVSPLAGEAKALESCPDEAFATGALGQGVYIEPSEGRVYAPCDGKIAMLFDTLHAIGIVTDDGLELLIHVGINTVTLGGNGFKAHVKAGDTIQAGDLLLEFDMDLIRSKGLSLATPVLVSNVENYPEWKGVSGKVSPGDTLITL